jgi:hypothetical protein
LDHFSYESLSSLHFENYNFSGSAARQSSEEREPERQHRGKDLDLDDGAALILRRLMLFLVNQTHLIRQHLYDHAEEAQPSTPSHDEDHVIPISVF